MFLCIQKSFDCTICTYSAGTLCRHQTLHTWEPSNVRNNLAYYLIENVFTIIFVSADNCSNSFSNSRLSDLKVLIDCVLFLVNP